MVTGLLALLLAGAVTGCGGSGPALVDSSTSAPAPATATAAPPTTRPGTTAVPTTEPIPTTTGRVPLTTGQTGPAGAPLTFRHLTIRLARGWRAGGGGDHVEVTTGRACRRSAGGVDCPGFLLLGPSQIAIASELSPLGPAVEAGNGQGRRQGRRLPRVAGRLRRRPHRQTRGRLPPAGLVPQGLGHPGRRRVVDPRAGPGAGRRPVRLRICLRRTAND